jgi:hypothetical protein
MAWVGCAVADGWFGTAWLDSEVMFDRLRRHNDDGQLISEADDGRVGDVKKVRSG